MTGLAGAVWDKQQSLQGSDDDKRKLEMQLSGPSLLTGGGQVHHPNQVTRATVRRVHAALIRLSRSWPLSHSNHRQH